MQAATSAEHQAFWHRRPVAQRSVLYESFAGNGALCNPEAIFRSLLAAPDFADLEHVWALTDAAMESDPIVGEFAGDNRVRFVVRGSPAYYRAISTCAWLVNNATFPPRFNKRDDQTYLNTWHGTPLKAMGYDMPNGALESRNVLRNFLMSDVLLSANSQMTDMYRRAYRLDGIYRGRILETGYPRVDHQFGDADEREQTRKSLRARGLAIGDEPVVLYAPTWRGASFSSPNAQVGMLRRLLDAAAQRDDLRHTSLLLKVHQAVYKQAASDPSLSGYLVPNDLPTNRVLAVSDVLVTDFSSVFFDFLATKRPIVFYAPDLDTYQDDRGFYLEMSDWPGPVTDQPEQAAALIAGAIAGTAQVAGEQPEVDPDAAAERFCPYEDGAATERVIDVVFRGHDGGARVICDFTNDKTSLVIYPGSLKPNGITNSAINLLEHIDHDRYDVSLFVLETNNRARRKNEARIDPRVRVIYRLGGMGGSKLALPSRNAVVARGEEASVPLRDLVSRALADEWRRCFGSSTFDHVIDFGGYFGLIDHILLQSGAPSKSIWQHNDLAADSRREVNGVRTQDKILRSVFGSYAGFDHIVSVSEALSKVNRDNLSEYADPDKFTFAPNTINAAQILRAAQGGRAIAAHPERRPSRDPNNLAESLGQLFDEYGAAEVADALPSALAVERWMPSAPNLTTFVTAGRLSPEKNHQRLIDAFAQVHVQRRDTRLVILGSGPLRQQLIGRIAEHGLERSVILAGQQANPYAFLDRADCFVLSSDYEGQPMVILEALIVGLPVVSTSFDSVSGALSPDDGLIVSRTVEGLAGGLQAFLDGGVPSKPFDADEYNAQAMRQFYRAIGAEPEPPTST